MSGSRIAALIVALLALGLGLAAGYHYPPMIEQSGLPMAVVGRVFLAILVLLGIADWLWRR